MGGAGPVETPDAVRAPAGTVGASSGGPCPAGVRARPSPPPLRRAPPPSAGRPRAVAGGGFSSLTTIRHARMQ